MRFYEYIGSSTKLGGGDSFKRRSQLDLQASATDYTAIAEPSRAEPRDWPDFMQR